MSDQPKRSRRPTKRIENEMFLSGPSIGKTYLPAYPSLPRQFANLLDQTAVEVLSALYPGLEVRKRFGDRMVTAYFEQPGFSKPIRWVVACVMTPELTSDPVVTWQRYKFEPLLSSDRIDRVLFVTEQELDPVSRDALTSLPAAEHVTISRLREMLNDRKPKRSGRRRVPTADGFVQVDHNNPAVEEAHEKLCELANEIDTSNTLQLARQERDALLHEIRILIGLLRMKAARLAHVQTAIGEQNVLHYLKGAFTPETRAAVLSVAIDRLCKAIFGS